MESESTQIAFGVVSGCIAFLHLANTEQEIEEFEESLNQRSRHSYLKDNFPRLFRTPDSGLQRKNYLYALLQDLGRNPLWRKIAISGDELLSLANILRPRMEQPRLNRSLARTNDCEHGMCRSRLRSCKVTCEERLFYAIRWLHFSDTFRSMEFDAGWAKSSIAEDIPHVLQAIVHEIEWPTAAERRILGQTFPIFPGCVGVVDGFEVFIRRPSDRALEAQHYSGKK